MKGNYAKHHLFPHFLESFESELKCKQNGVLWLHFKELDKSGKLPFFRPRSHGTISYRSVPVCLKIKLMYVFPNVFMFLGGTVMK